MPVWRCWFLGLLCMYMFASYQLNFHKSNNCLKELQSENISCENLSLQDSLHLLYSINPLSYFLVAPTLSGTHSR